MNISLKPEKKLLCEHFIVNDLTQISKCNFTHNKDENRALQRNFLKLHASILVIFNKTHYYTRQEKEQNYKGDTLIHIPQNRTIQ